MDASHTDRASRTGLGVTEFGPAVGWRFFAGLVTFLLGVMNLVDGLLAITDSDFFAQNVSPNTTLPVTDRIEVWGWVVLVVGIVMVVIAFPIIFGSPLARFAGIAVAAVDLLLQFAYLAHFPLWSLIMISLNVLVIFGLAARVGATTDGAASS
jgi:hypothetical protein